MRSVEITLGGKPVTVRELPTRQNAAWRKQLQGQFGALVAVLMAAPAVELNGFKDLATVLGGLSEHLIGSVDALTALVLAYAPELNNKKTLEDVYDSEILEAFAKILTLAFPFGVWGEKAAPMIRDLVRLSANKPTTTN